MLTLVLEILKQIKEKGPVDKGDGLCMTVIDYRYNSEFTAKFDEAGLSDVLGSTITGILQSYWVQWPFYTGCLRLPVPAPIGWKLEDSAEEPYYDIFHTVDDMWSGEYGAFRKDLVNWLIERLESAVSPG